MKQLEPAATTASQAFVPVLMAKSAGLAPAMLTPLIFSAALPVLERVTASVPLVVPIVWLVNATGLGVSDAAGAAAAVPVPVRVAVCGELAALSATESVAEKLVAEAGVKVT